MTVRELMARLINCDMNKQVIIELTEEDEKLLFSRKKARGVFEFSESVYISSENKED